MRRVVFTLEYEVEWDDDDELLEDRVAEGPKAWTDYLYQSDALVSDMDIVVVRMEYRVKWRNGKDG